MTPAWIASFWNDFLLAVPRPMKDRNLESMNFHEVASVEFRLSLYFAHVTTATARPGRGT
jgi:hypothetical protein